MRRYFGRWWPYIVAVLVTCVWRATAKDTFPTDFGGLMAASSTVAAVLIGFLATAKAFMLGMSDSSVYKSLKNGGYTIDLFARLSDGLFGGVTLLVTSIVGFFVLGDAKQPPLDWFTSAWVYFASLAVLVFYRMASILFRLLKLA